MREYPISLPAVYENRKEFILKNYNSASVTFLSTNQPRFLLLNDLTSSLLTSWPNWGTLRVCALQALHNVLLHLYVNNIKRWEKVHSQNKKVSAVKHTLVIDFKFPGNRGI